MIKVIHVISDTNIGGAGYVVLNCLKHFDREKFLVKVALPAGSLLKPEVEKLNYEVIETKYGADKSFDFRAISEFKKIFKAERPDVVHTHSSLSARIAAKRCEVRLRIYSKHCIAAAGKLHGTLGNKLSTHVIAVNPIAKDILIEAGVKSERVKVILNGVEPLRKLADDEKVAARAKFNIAENDFVFGMVARLVPFKGHKYFIDAAKIVCEQFENCKFLIVGTGEEEQRLKKQTADLGLTDKIIFAGFQSDVAVALNIMDVVVNCSLDTEASSLALAEGFSLGKPAIATIGGGNRYMVGNGVNGLLTPIADAPATAEAMKQLLEDRSLLSLLSRRAYEYYTENFTAEIMTRQVERIYES